MAIRGGGHATTGASGTDGGLLIDLRKMRNVTVDVKNKIVTVEGGARVRDIEPETFKHGQCTILAAPSMIVDGTDSGLAAVVGVVSLTV